MDKSCLYVCMFRVRKLIAVRRNLVSGVHIKNWRANLSNFWKEYIYDTKYRTREVYNFNLTCVRSLTHELNYLCNDRHVYTHVPKINTKVNDEFKLAKNELGKMCMSPWSVLDKLSCKESRMCLASACYCGEPWGASRYFVGGECIKCDHKHLDN